MHTFNWIPLHIAFHLPYTIYRIPLRERIVWILKIANNPFNCIWIVYVCNTIFEYAKITLQDANGLPERKGIQLYEENYEKHIIYFLEWNRCSSNWMQIGDCVILIWETENCIWVRKKVRKWMDTMFRTLWIKSDWFVPFVTCVSIADIFSNLFNSFTYY